MAPVGDASRSAADHPAKQTERPCRVSCGWRCGRPRRRCNTAAWKKPCGGSTSRTSRTAAGRPLCGQAARAFVERGERAPCARTTPRRPGAICSRPNICKRAEKNADRLREALTRLGMAEVRALLQAGEPGRAEEAVARLRGQAGPLAGAASAGRGGPRLAGGPRPGRPRRVRAGGGGGGPRPPAGAGRCAFWKNTGAIWNTAAGVSPPCWCGCTRRPSRPLADAIHGGRGGAGRRPAARRGPQGPRPGLEDGRAGHASATGPPEAETAAARATGSPDRFLLWIDGVGGYLVCLGIARHASARRSPVRRSMCRWSPTCRGCTPR